MWTENSMRGLLFGPLFDLINKAIFSYIYFKKESYILMLKLLFDINIGAVYSGLCLESQHSGG